jgi:hypothetical protein
MAGCDRQPGQRDVAFDFVQVGVTDAAGLDPDAHLACPWFGHRDLGAFEQAVLDRRGTCDSECEHGQFNHVDARLASRPALQGRAAGV